MTLQRNMRNAALAAALALLAAGGAAAQDGPAAGPGADREDPVAPLLEQLAKPDQEGWRQIESEIAMEWSKSGSPAMDLLLQRAREAMDEEEFDVALEHLGALTDHAPDFAEGWNARAMVWYAREEFGLALDDLLQALARNPQHFGALSGLALTLEKLGQFEPALRALRAAREVHPHRPDLIEAEARLEKKSGGRRL